MVISRKSPFLMCGKMFPYFQIAELWRPLFLLSYLVFFQVVGICSGAPAINVTPSSLTFSGQTYSAISPQAIAITNTGDATLNYTITSDMFWLSVSNATGSLVPGAGTSVVVRVATRGLAPRTYSGHLMITDSSATNSPQVVAMSLSINSLIPPGLVVAWGNNDYGQTNVPVWLTNAVAVAGGGYFSLALKSDSTVVAWGVNNFGQTNVPEGLTNVVAVAGGGLHSLALKSDSTVVAWGRNNLGQAGIPLWLTNAMAVAAGGHHSLALRSDGTVVAWGRNDLGQTNVPVGLTNAVAVACGGQHSLALKSDGTVVAWGHSDWGQTNVPEGLANVVAVAGGDFHSLALKSDGTVVAWGDIYDGQTNVPVWLANVVTVAGGDLHSLALNSDGTIVSWGSDSYVHTNVPIWLTNAVAVAGGLNHSLALVPAESLIVSSIYDSSMPANGTNWLIRNTSQICTAPPQIMGTTQYACIGWVGSGSVPGSGTSNSVSFTITNSSTLTWLWSTTNYWLGLKVNGGGTLNTGSFWCASGSNVVLTASNLAGYTFLGWRGDTNGCVINGMEMTIPMTGPRSIMVDFTGGYISAAPSSLIFSGEAYSTIVPQSVTVTNTGDCMLNYVITSDSFWLSVSNANASLVPGASTSHVVQVATRGLAPRNYSGHLIVTDPSATNNPQIITVNLIVNTLMPPSAVMAWGLNNDGQTDVPAWLTNAVAVAGGCSHSLALRSDGTTVAWGCNDNGQTNVPAWLSNVVEVAAGGYGIGGYSLALRSDDTVVAWGYNGEGQTNVPVWLTNAVAVAAGGLFSLALRSDGTVVAWGNNGWGETNVPAGLTDVVTMVGAVCHSLALRSGGTVVAWGDNTSGQTNVPVWLTNAVAVAGGRDHSLALRSDGTVVAWGDNTYGQTNVPEELSNVVAVAGGDYHSLALKSDGTVVAWGMNSVGQMDVPLGLTNTAMVAAGDGHSLALVPTESLIVSSLYGSPSPDCGTNWLIRNTPQTCTVPPQVITIGTTQYACKGWAGSGSVPNSGTSNSVTFYLTNSSTLTWLWDPTNYWLQIQINGGGTVNTDSFWCASGSNLVLTASNLAGYTFLGWHGDTNDCVTNGTQITIPVTGPRSIIADFTGIYVVPSSLTFSGEVNRAVAPQSITITNTANCMVNYTITCDFWLSTSAAGGSLASGMSTSITVRAATYGLAPLSYRNRIIITDSLATNSSQVVFVNTILTLPPPPGMVVAWGSNDSGQTNVPVWLTNAVAVAAGCRHSLALRSDGTAVAWGQNTSGQTNVPVWLTNAVAVASGMGHCLALRSDGTVVAWGYNGDGRTNVPDGLTNVVAVAGGGNHSLALKSDGTVVAWGWNSYDQTNVPVWLTNVIAVAGGAAHSLVLRSDGTVVSWGQNTSGQTNVPAGLSNVVMVVGGGENSLALRSDGTVVSWGLGDYGQTNIPIGLTNVVMVADGYFHSLLLRSDGTVVSLGANPNGQDVPVWLTNVVAVAGGDFHSLALLPVESLIVSSMYDSPNPAIGTNWVIRNTPQTCSVNTSIVFGTTQYLCIGWTGSGSVPLSGTSNNVSFIITNNSAIIWFWNTNYWINLQSQPSGHIVTPPSGWYSKDALLTCQAFLTNYCTFVCWTNSIISTNNPLDFTVTGPAQLEALFVEELTTNTSTPKWWLAQYGWTSNFDEAATNDTDNDSMVAWQEYIAGTDPTTNSSVFQILSNALDNAGSNFVLSWTSASNRLYDIFQSTDLVNNVLSPVYSNIPPSPPVNVFTNSTGSAGSGFFRVNVRKP